MKERIRVISAYPGTGKSYICNTFSNGAIYYSDSDSSLFSWIYENGVKTEKRNPDFPANYIAHIKDLLDHNCDFIFVSSHLQVRQALQDAGIKFLTVYPGIDLKDEYLKRYRDRGNDKNFIDFQDKHWDEFVGNIENEPHGECIYRLNRNEHLWDMIMYSYSLMDIEREQIEWMSKKR